MNIGDDIKIDGVEYVVVEVKGENDVLLALKEPKPPWERTKLGFFLNSDKNSAKYWAPVPSSGTGGDYKFIEAEGQSYIADGYFVKTTERSPYCNMVGGCYACGNGACWKSVKKA